MNLGTQLDIIKVSLPFMLLWALSAGAGDKFFRPTMAPYFNGTRTTPVGIAAYRSALTLDWLSAEDHRQRELVSAFESQPVISNKMISNDCVGYPRPAAGTVARLMLEMLKNLEGDSDNKSIIHDLFQALVRSKLLKLELSVFENEPDLEALVKTPIELAGEPHITFPRMMAIAWMAITDPSTVKKHGWCTINRITKYVNSVRPAEIAMHMRSVDPIVSRARYIMEEFIQNVTPLNMMKSSISSTTTRKFKAVIGRPRSELPPVIKPRPTRVQRYTPELKQLVLANVTPIAINLAHLKTTVTNELMDYEWPSACQDAGLPEIGIVEPDLSTEDRGWHHRSSSKNPSDEFEKPCLMIHPTARDIVKRFYAILPYFDKEHANKAFLHKFRGTVNIMSQTEDLLDREAAFYATVLTPVVFLQSYRDTWCLLERFHRALRLYQISHPTEKRSALKLLQNLRAVNHKVRSFILDMESTSVPTKRTTLVASDFDDEEFRDKKDIRYLKELIKNLG